MMATNFRDSTVCYTDEVSGICPICNKPAALRAENASAPFCSPRCKRIDLGNWFGNQYRIPTNERSDGTSNDDDGDLAAGNRKEMPS